MNMNDSEQFEYLNLCCEYNNLTENKQSSIKEINEKLKEIEDFQKKLLKSHNIDTKEWSKIKHDVEYILKPKKNIHIDTLTIDNLIIKG